MSNMKRTAGIALATAALMTATPALARTTEASLASAVSVDTNGNIMINEAYSNDAIEGAYGVKSDDATMAPSGINIKCTTTNTNCPCPH